MPSPGKKLPTMQMTRNASLGNLKETEIKNKALPPTFPKVSLKQKRLVQIKEMNETKEQTEFSMM